MEPRAKISYWDSTGFERWMVDLPWCCLHRECGEKMERDGEEGLNTWSEKKRMPPRRPVLINSSAHE